MGILKPIKSDPRYITDEDYEEGDAGLELEKLCRDYIDVVAQMTILGEYSAMGMYALESRRCEIHDKICEPLLEFYGITKEDTLEIMHDLPKHIGANLDRDYDEFDLEYYGKRLFVKLLDLKKKEA